MFFGNMPFGFGGPPGYDQQQQQNDETFYNLLEVQENATQQQIKEKFKQLKQKYSSGEDANAYKLQIITQAFQILSDPQQKKQYDQQLAQQKQLYQMMHGQSKKEGKGPKQKPKMQPMKKQIEVTLQKLYTGGNIPHFHQRARMCDVCDGKGGKDVKKCAQCKGQGAVVKMVQVGPGMYAQAQENCQNCSGMGDIFGEGGKCQTCEGRKIVKKGVDLQVSIPAGAPSGHSITIQNQGNEVQSVRAGDLILIVSQQPNQQFTRKGADLLIKRNVSLIQTLLGFHFEIVHLDSKKYTIYTRPGDIIGDGHKKIVKGLGMPFFDEPQQNGNLIIQFKVVMPKRGQMTAQQIKVLGSCLPGQINPRPKDTNYQMLQDFDRQGLNSNEEGGKRQQDGEDEQEGGIGCQAQ